MSVNEMAKILLVDDQRNMRTTLSMMLEAAGHDVEAVEDGDTACQVVGIDNYDLVITDLKMQPTDGLEVLRYTKEVAPLTEVILMTAYGTIDSAVESIRMGAHDYIQKPFSEDELMVKAEKALERRKLANEMSVVAAEFRERYHFENIIGRSAPIRDVLARIVRVAPTDATALITGASGTGKELIARAIHANSSRAERPFVSVNCAAISETLLESELFGHVKGSFTGAVSSRRGLFEQANGGTFFFDEIAETPPAFQAKLLRAIQEGEIRRVGDEKTTKVDIRIVAATNQDLKVAIAEKRFREDLYYRLNVARFILPPLRERREDIPLLVEFFLHRFGQKMKRNATLGPGVMDYLVRYDFPGNIRELENMVEQGMALCVNQVVQVEDIMPPEVEISSLKTGSQSLQEVVDKAEAEAIDQALLEYKGSKEKAAEVLGLSTTTLWRKMKRLGIQG